MDLITGLSQNEWIELVAAVLSLLYLYLEIKEKPLLWFVGIVSSALYAHVYFKSHFYADFGLQVYYVFISVYGWINWNKGAGNSTEKQLPIRRISLVQIFYLLGSMALIYSVLLVILLYLPGYIDLSSSSFPYMDSFTVAASLIGTWMLTKKILEQWLVWIVINFISIIMFWMKHLDFTAILFIIYTIGSVVGYINWLKHYRNQKLQSNA
jgi:nicotinamide mononucleotide transporter